MDKNLHTSYSAKDIVTLEGLDAVRKRPGMYIGTTGAKGLHHILWEIVDNAMDEAMNGYADKISVTIYDDNSVSVEDNGRGIPVDDLGKKDKTALEEIFTVLHAGGKFDNEKYEFSGGLHGVGASVTNALSKWLRVKVFSGGSEYIAEFHSPEVDGKIKSGQIKMPLTKLAPSKKRGTLVTFLPDDKVFDKELYNYDLIKNRLRELAFLNKGITLSVEDRRVKNEEGAYKKSTNLYNGGISDFVEYVNRANAKQGDKVIYVESERKAFKVQLAMQYTESYGEKTISFVNNIPTTEGGSHETGFRSAITKCMNDYARKNNLLKQKDANLLGEDYRDGMTAILSIKMQNVQFEGQTKTKLGNPEVKGIVESMISEQLDLFFSIPKNKDSANYIVKRGIEAAKVRDAEKKAKDAQRLKNATTGSVLVGKFSACSGKDPTKNELFIVEGDSAGGSAKQGRDRSFQAILPLKGKPLNTEKKRIDEILKNDEIRAIIYALGTDFYRDFNIKNLKYHKIIILADADQDGAHIRAILLTFFYRYMRQLISEGHVYIGMPPLYKVQKKSDIRYAYNDNELENITTEFKSGYVIQRYKGLGEMNYDQLWDTTLDPKKRTLMRVTIDDAAEAELIISTLMGDNVELRKAFINENANFNKTDNFAEKHSE
ncbi:MAG: DNA gyrase subunit B [Firmicutes bacterium]|nr:DNA gyrase subunit B [Bacillota bacterium]